MSVKQLEKKVSGLEAKRAKAHADLIFTEEQLGFAYGELTAARKSEPLKPVKAANKPKEATASATT